MWFLISNDVPDAPGIARAANPNTQVVIYDANHEKLDAIDSFLGNLVSASGKKIDHLAVASHGDPGAIYLGSEKIDLTNLHEHKGEFEQLAQNLSPNAQIQLYGCNVAAAGEGQSLVNSIAAITGAEVFASKHTTGAQPNNWSLEYSSDPLKPMASVLDPEKLEHVQGDLAQMPVTTLTSPDPQINSFGRHIPGNDSRMPVANGAVIFSANAGTGNGFEVYQSNNVAGVAAGGAAGQTAMTNFTPFDPHISGLVSANGSIYYSGYVSATAGTELLRSNPGDSSVAPTPITHFGETAIPAGNTQINNYDPHIQLITPQGPAIYFVAQQGGVGHGVAASTGAGFEVWKSFGTNNPGHITDNPASPDAPITNFIGIQGEAVDPHITELVPARDGTSIYFTGDGFWGAGVGDTAVAVRQGQEIWHSNGGVPAAGSVTDVATNNGAITAFGQYAELPTYNPDISQLTPAVSAASTSTLYFVANDTNPAAQPGLGYQVWRSDGTPPTAAQIGVGGQRVNNANADFGNVSNFTNGNPNIRDLIAVHDSGAATDHIYFVANATGTGDQIWRSNGGVAPAGGTDFGQQTAFTSAEDDISQLTANGTDLYFVANGGTGAAPNYQIYRVKATTAAGSVELVTNFNSAAIAHPTGLPSGINSLDPLLQDTPAHTDPHIKLITFTGGNTLWFEADSVNNKSRELFSVDITQASPTAGSPPVEMQRTNFGFGEPNIAYLTDAGGGNPAFVAHAPIIDANGVVTGYQDQIFTIGNSGPQAVVPSSTAPYVLNKTVLEDNNNTNTNVSLPNALRVFDPDMQNRLTVDVNAVSGFTSLTFPASVGQVTSTQITPTHWKVEVPAATANIDYWAQQGNINDILSNMQALLVRDSNNNTDAINGTTHLINVQVDDNSGAPNHLSAITPLQVFVTPVDDSPTLNQAAPYTITGYPTTVPAFPGTQTITSGQNLVFNTANGNPIIALDVDAHETAAVIPPLPVPNPSADIMRGEIQMTLSAAGLGDLSLPSTTGLVFSQGTGAHDQSMTFTGSLANINNDLNGLTFTPNMSDFTTGRTLITVTANDLGRTGQAQPGATGVTTGTIPVQINPPAGDFWGRHPRLS